MIAACAVLLAACSGGSGETTTTTVTTLPSEVDTTTTTEVGPVTFTLTEADDGVNLVLRPGDEVVVRLRAGVDPSDQWSIISAPNSNILGGGDSMVFEPSEPGGRVTRQEFTFIALKPGATSVTLGRGVTASPTFTMQVAVRSRN